MQDLTPGHVLSVAANVLFSLVGDSVATRAASMTWFIWLGILAFRLLRIAEGRTVGPAT
jgi:hypothetical protein